MIACGCVVFSFFGHAVSLGSSVEPHPPTDSSRSPLEILLVEDLRRKLRETAEDIWERTNRLLAREAAKSADQAAASLPAQQYQEETIRWHLTMKNSRIGKRGYDFEIPLQKPV